MPQGYYTIEQWLKARSGEGSWVAVAHLPFGLSLTAAEAELAKWDKPGFYRLVQMQRVIWAERENGNLRLRKSHATSPQNLDRQRTMFDQAGGKFPVEEVRKARQAQKRAQKQ